MQTVTYVTRHNDKHHKGLVIQINRKNLGIKARPLPKYDYVESPALAFSGREKSFK